MQGCKLCNNRFYTNERNELPQIFIDNERSLVHTISVLANVSVVEYKLKEQAAKVWTLHMRE